MPKNDQSIPEKEENKLCPLDHQVRAKVEEFLDDKGLKSTALGAALMGKKKVIKEEEGMLRSRASRFFNGKTSVCLRDIYRISKSFNKPLEYFLGIKKASSRSSQTNTAHDNGQIDAKQFSAESQTFTINDKENLKAEGQNLEKMLGGDLSEEEKQKVEDFMSLLASKILKK